MLALWFDFWPANEGPWPVPANSDKSWLGLSLKAAAHCCAVLALVTWMCQS